MRSIILLQTSFNNDANITQLSLKETQTRPQRIRFWNPGGFIGHTGTHRTVKYRMSPIEARVGTHKNRAHPIGLV